MRRSLRRLGRVIVLVIGLSVIMTAIYRVVPPPLTPLMVIRLFEGNWISKDWVSYDAISPNLMRAVIAAEDSGYCAHWGFDFAAIQKAFRHNEKSGRLRGGSTISNQTAKNVFLWPGDTMLTRYARKAIEPYFTLLVEVMWGKRRILEVYLNVVEWAPGVYGAEAAARHHFRKPAADLTRREAALLAAVLPNPRRFSASKPSSYISRRAGQIQAWMNDVPDPAGDPCLR
ncbi:monofunctional biosynthetic peptidoglycan transglycosylase [Dongia deserti]|uniref:monofunctional biosynthetic peptidoglycan transglycosylase n=1 Tax=Dongia deserti TaxID=2268030 RepID=UPI000E655886|nr:monofunctional biosynthetic peptidoglycan transglycosylase [Dongia deserti]